MAGLRLEPQRDFINHWKVEFGTLGACASFLPIGRVVPGTDLNFHPRRGAISRNIIRYR